VAGGPANIEIALGPIASDATGSLSYSVTLDTSISGATAAITVTKLDGSAVSGGVINATPATYGTAKTGTLNLASGQYLVQTLVTEASPGNRTRGHNDVLNIYRGLTTDLNYSFNANSWDIDVDDFDLSQYIPAGKGGRTASNDFVKQGSQYTLSNLVWADADGNTISDGGTFPFKKCTATAEITGAVGRTLANCPATGKFTYTSPGPTIIVSDVGYDAANKTVSVSFAPLEASLDMSDASPASCDAYIWNATKNMYTIADNVKLTLSGTTTERQVNLESGANSMLILNNASIDVSSVKDAAAIDCGNGTVNMTLEGANTLKSGETAAGLQCNAGATVNIKGNGSLTATGGYGGAGIGSSSNADAGTININGPVTIIATGGTNAAGIGGGAGASGGTASNGSNGCCGTIYISGATIFACGGTDGLRSGAGIGYGSASAGTGTIQIKDSIIYSSATKNGDGASIGEGNYSQHDDCQIEIENSTVVAFGANHSIMSDLTSTALQITGSSLIASKGIKTSDGTHSSSVIFASSVEAGVTQDSTCKTVTVSADAAVVNSSEGDYPTAGTITLKANLDLNGQTLIIPAGWTLDCDATNKYTVTNGTVKLAATLTMPDGTVLAAGQLTNAGDGSVTPVTE
jgi:hypothetical protein